jgi:AraC family transcriptional regulator
MEWLECMNRALDYLEANLDGDADIGEAAKLACSSRFHFQRVFSVLCGVTAADYLRGRRLTLAAQELALGDGRVLDVALKFGYETPEAFARAFKRFHGISPSEAREPGVRLRALPRLKFIVSVKGDKDMDYRIIKKDAFRVVGKCLHVSTADGENFVKIPKFWGDCMADGTWQKLMPLDEGGGAMGICANFAPDMGEFDYLIAVANERSAVPAGLMEMRVPPLTWAVFDAVGKLPGSIQSVTQKIYSEWFPASSFEHADGPELEVYPPGDMDSDGYRCEVWIPVSKKQQD